ncbi:4-vinyl reductase [Desulfovibrio sp. OttesenSCG-928-A18]|nr:4-vinyl reductase [Desulfovibrio sp. OttesenSCG-928-A18]
MSEQRKYAFEWDSVIGDMNVARPELGPTTRVEVYRLFQFALRDELEKQYGTEKTDELFRAAGVLAGENFYKKFCSKCTSVSELAKTLQELFKEMGIGILRVEKSDLDKLAFTLTVDEDLDCSGMPDTNDVICVYDEGFIQGILQSFTGKGFFVRETDCWCTGERTCRFTATPI